MCLSFSGTFAQNEPFEHAPGVTYAFWTQVALGLPSNSSTPAPVPSATTINLTQDVLVDVLRVDPSALNSTRSCYDGCLRTFFESYPDFRSCGDAIDDL